MVGYAELVVENKCVWIEILSTSHKKLREPTIPWSKLMNLQADISPSYEIRLKYGRKVLVIVASSFSFAEALLLLFFSQESWSEYPLFAFPIFILTSIVLLLFMLGAKGSEDALVRFVNSVSNLIISWALVGPSVTGKYNAYCELKDGYYASLEQNLSKYSGYKAVLLSISKFITGPEPASKAPMFKSGWDNRTLKPTILPFQDEEVDSWKKSSEKWKRQVSEDRVIRSWMAQNCDWRSLHYTPTARGIYSIAMHAHYGYQRNPSVRDGWLKGTWLAVDFFFRIPTPSDASRLSNLYLDMIDIGKRIIQYIEEGM